MGWVGGLVYRMSSNGGTSGGGGGATNHGNERLEQRNISQEDVDKAIESAKETGQVMTKIGKYGTPQNIYNGANGLTVVVETAGRNAGKIITAWWRW
ncbi:MAG: DUF4258 domain-containing protein [Acidobacteriaceae bacterium]|nr:DUF4258 domain-containing protein [Acidobacteriaceae bacterium]